MIPHPGREMVDNLRHSEHAHQDHVNLLDVICTFLTIIIMCLNPVKDPHLKASLILHRN